MSLLWRILLGDEAAGGGGSAVAASSDAGSAGGSSTTDTSTDSPSDGDGSGTTDAATTGTDADDYSYAPPPEDETDNGEEDTGSAGGLDTAPSPTLTGDAAVAALLAQGQAPAASAPAPAPVQAAAPAPVVAAGPDVSAVIKGFADAVGLEANDPALKSFTDILSTAQSEAQAAKQALQQQSQLASVERLFTVMESAPGYSPEVFGEADTLSGDAKFGLTAEQLQRRTAVDLQAAQLFKAAKDAGKPISAKAAIRQAVEKVASFYPTSTPKPAAPKPQGSPTAMAPGRTQASKRDPFAEAVRAYEKSRKSL